MILTTPRLILRDFREDDWTAVFDYHNNPLYQRYYPLTAETAEQSQAFVHMFLEQQQTIPRTKFQLAITRKGDDTLIGNCGVRQTSGTAREADIGYELNPDYWGQGYTTEAAQAIVHFGFTTLRCHRLAAECVADNSGSARVLHKLGFRQEGQLRENQFFKGYWWDTLLFGLLDYEWEAEQIDQNNF